MYFLNDMDIDDLVRVTEQSHPEVAPFARYLAQWRDIVNSNSDGWAYWRVGPNAAKKLMKLLEPLRFRRPLDGPAPAPAIADLRKALTPIKSACTRHGLPQPTLR